VHQIGPKDSGSQNFRFLALKAEPVSEVQILRTATARDGRKKIYRSNHVFTFRIYEIKHITAVSTRNATS
jgi:hypothetical protein